MFQEAGCARELQRIVDEVEEEIFKTYDREVQSGAVGQLVTDRLRRVDQVAYVRFASVYKEFKTLEDLVEEAKAVIEARRFEDPSQGQLFVDAAHPPRDGNPGGNGNPEGNRDPGGSGVETSGETGPSSGRRLPRGLSKVVKQPAAVVRSRV